MPKLLFPRYDSRNSRFVLVVLGMWIATLLLCGLLYWVGPSTVPLWYSRTQITDQLAPSWAIFSLAGMSTLLTFIGFLFGRSTDLEHEKYLASLNWWAVIFLQGLLLLALLRIMKVVL